MKTSLNWPQMLDLADEDTKAVIITVFKESK